MSQPDPQKIVHAVVELGQDWGFTATAEDVFGRSRDGDVTVLRSLSVLAMRSLAGLSYPAAARLLGRDHSTLVKNMKKLHDDYTDTELARILDAVEDAWHDRNEKQLSLF